MSFGHDRAPMSRPTLLAVAAVCATWIGNAAASPETYVLDPTHTYGLAFATEDGGKTWASIASRIPNRKGKHLYRIGARGAQVWLVAEQGALFKAADAASPFVEQPVPYAGTLFGMVAYGDDEWVIYGLRGNAFHTADAGRSWTRVVTAEAVTLTHGLRLNDGRIALANQSGHILVSSDRGQHFLIRDTTWSSGCWASQSRRRQRCLTQMRFMSASDRSIRPLPASRTAVGHINFSPVPTRTLGPPCGGAGKRQEWRLPLHCSSWPLATFQGQPPQEFVHESSRPSRPPRPAHRRTRDAPHPQAH